MAVPFRRTSKTKKRMRRTHLKKEGGAITSCKKCGAAIRPHRACTKCGNYKNENVLDVVIKANSVITKKDLNVYSYSTSNTRCTIYAKDIKLNVISEKDVFKALREEKVYDFVKGLIDATDKVTEANELMDYTALKEGYGECVQALDKFYEIVYPTPLEEKHSKLLSVMDREKRMNEILESMCGFYVKYDSYEPELTPEEQTEMQNLQDEFNRIFDE